MHKQICLLFYSQAIPQSHSTEVWHNIARQWTGNTVSNNNIRLECLSTPLKPPYKQPMVYKDSLSATPQVDVVKMQSQIPPAIVALSLLPQLFLSFSPPLAFPLLASCTKHDTKSPIHFTLLTALHVYSMHGVWSL